MYVKGVAIPIVTLIVMVAIAAISIFLISQAISPIKSLIENIFGGFFGARELSLVEKAVLCSYYRCAEGCNSENTMEFCKDFTNMNGLHYCEEIIPKDGGKICSWNAVQFPIEVEVSNQIIEKEKLKEKRIVDCIVSERTKGVLDWWDVAQMAIPIWNIIKGLSNFASGSKIIFVTENIANDIEREDCSVSGITFSKAVKKATISEYIYIFTVDNTICLIPGIACSPIYYTEIRGEELYVKNLEQGMSTTQSFFKDLPYRVVLKVGEERLNYILKPIEISFYGGDHVKFNLTYKNETSGRIESVERTITLDKGYQHVVEKNGEKIGSLIINLTEIVEADKEVKMKIEFSFSIPEEKPEYLPDDQDSWTESDGSYWFPVGNLNCTDAAKGDCSIEVSGIFYSFHILLPDQIADLKNWHKLNFKLKADERIGSDEITTVQFSDLDVRPLYGCEVREPFNSNEWKFFSINLENCEECKYGGCGEGSIYYIYFWVKSTPYERKVKIDNLYLCKNC